MAESMRTVVFEDVWKNRKHFFLEASARPFAKGASRQRHNSIASPGLAAALRTSPVSPLC